MYKAKNVDTDKVLAELNYAKKVEENLVNFEIAKQRALLEGINKGLSIAESLFKCSNYEKDNITCDLEDVLRIIQDVGGLAVSAADEYSKGWNDAVDHVYEAVKKAGGKNEKAKENTI